jgi:hypothetical protein
VLAIVVVELRTLLYSDYTLSPFSYFLAFFSENYFHKLNLLDQLI